MSFFAVDPDMTTHQIDQPHTDREPQPGAPKAPARRVIDLRKRPKQPIDAIGRNANTGVLHRKPQRLPTPAGDIQPHLTLIGELDGIVGQIEQHLPQPHRIPDHPIGHIGLDMHHQPQSLLIGDRRHELPGRVDDLAQREGNRLDIELIGLDLRKIEDVIEHRQQRIGRLHDGIGIVMLLRRQRRIGEQLSHAHQAIHRRADLMRHRREERALGLGRFERLVARGLQLGRAPTHPRFERLIEPLGRLMQPGIGQRDGSLQSQQLHHLHPLAIEGTGDEVVLQIQHPDEPVAGLQRHAQHRQIRRLGQPPVVKPLGVAGASDDHRLMGPRDKMHQPMRRALRRDQRLVERPMLTIMTPLADGTQRAILLGQ